MCGITGFFSSEPLSDGAADLLSRQMDTLHHRGPDGRGAHLDRARGLAMGHTRLSIIDLHTGDQPLRSPDGRRVLTVNGEFYDFKRQRAHAMAEGARYQCKSDSEIALTLHAKHGLDFLSHLRGEFAFALYDGEREELLLVRDRFGIRPLFYHLSSDGRTLVYGSEVKSVLAHPEVPRELAPEAVLHQLMQVMRPGSSAFREVRALEPGRYLRVRRRANRLELREGTYWDLDFPREADRPAEEADEEHIERIRGRLIESIVFRLEADVPVGCYLSGGIDSCCILGLATGAMQSPVKAFTISFDHDAYDEASIARQMAASMRADQELIHLTADDLYGDNFIQTVWHTERTFYNTLGVAKNLMSRRVRECGYKTVITGEGADELFAGYPAFKRDMFRHGLEHEPPERVREYREAMDRTNKLFTGAILAETEVRHPAWEALCGFTPSWIQPWMGTLELARPLLSDDLRDRLSGYDPVGAIAEKIDPAMLEGRHPLDKAQYTWSKAQLEGQILNWGGDRVDMANSMESRPAFLDHHVAEAAVRVPPHTRIRGNIEKWVLREAVRGVLPEVLYKREKFAFMAPPAHTDERKKARVRELIGTYLAPGAIRDAGLLSPSRVGDFLERWERGTDNVFLTRADTVLNHMLCLQILHEQFVRNSGGRLG
jgi:asparagine synthase (glutamine-hydrolysing)